MICKHKQCSQKAEISSDFCLKHRAAPISANFYFEWDEGHWLERRRHLREMWQQGQSTDAKKRLIADLLIHAHDLQEQ